MVAAAMDPGASGERIQAANSGREFGNCCVGKQVERERVQLDRKIKRKRSANCLEFVYLRSIACTTTLPSHPSHTIPHPSHTHSYYNSWDPLLRNKSATTQNESSS